MKQQAKLYFCKQEVPNFHTYFVCENDHKIKKCNSWTTDLYVM